MAFIDITAVQQELGVSSGVDTVMLGSIIDAVLALWDMKTNRTWAKTTYTEYYDSPIYSSVLYLNNYPVDSTATFQIWDDPDWNWDSDSLIDSDDYRVDYERGVVYYNGYFYEGKQSIKVSYTAGYSDDNVPKWLKQILVRQAAFWYKQAKEHSWDVSSLNLGDGASVSFETSITGSKARNNILAEFEMAARLNRRIPGG